MAHDRRTHAHDTHLDVTMPFSLFCAGGVMCSDGKVRNLKRISETADTFFSIPAAVNVTVEGRSRTVAGYVTIECASGSSVETPDDPTVAKFIAYQYRANADALPRGAWKRT